MSHTDAVQIRNLVLTVVGIITVNVVGPLLHGLAKPVVLFGLGGLFLAAILANAWLGHRALRRRDQP